MKGIRAFAASYLVRRAYGCSVRNSVALAASAASFKVRTLSPTAHWTDITPPFWNQMFLIVGYARPGVSRFSYCLRIIRRLPLLLHETRKPMR